ncbi:SLATT domain-containing protein [Rhodococcoides fascians]|uniref:SLATT domain-containing protein n=1 Tax=Rhodococcoides fascians TaxID=1828 RepID=UPI0018AF70F5
MWFRKQTSEPTTPDEHYAVPPDVSPDLTAIGRELSRLEESARWSSQNQFEQGKFWRGCNLALGIPATLLGLGSGGAAITDLLPALVVGAATLGAAALTGIMTVLGAERRARTAQTCADAFHDIQDEARRMLLVDLRSSDALSARDDLRALTDRYSETRHTAEAPAGLFYRRARKNLSRGGQTFAIDHPPQTSPTP